MTTFSATYSPDDNKLRLYASTRLDRETYERVKAAGFAWAPRQELFVAPMWTPAREDLLLELAGEIGDEDTSLVERAADRAERFGDYAEKRAADADHAHRAVEAITEGIPLGQPILVGHHSERRARKDQERIEAGMRRAVRMWETSGYWKSRAAGAIRAVKYKERPDVRARRIKGLEADQRKHERERREAEKFLTAWRKIGQTNDPDAMLRRALLVANYDHSSQCFPLADYPRQPPASQYEGRMSLWSALDGGVITAIQAVDLAAPAHERAIARHDRWLAHIANRLEYERAMLAESGGTVADRTGPERGGACRSWASPRGGWSFIRAVNRVTVTIHDNRGYGGGNFRRIIRLDEIQALMTAAEVQAARNAGTLMEVKGGCGFVLANAPPAVRPEAPPERPAAEPAATFDAMKAQLRAGVKVVVARQLFPTPPDIASDMAAIAHILEDDRVLEPSAGTGRLLDAMLGAGARSLVAVELNRNLAAALRRQYVAADVRQGDFLELGTDQLGKFDVILMNPPFEKGADIKHIEHARRLLRPGGRLVALCADGPRQHERLNPTALSWTRLPPDTFADQGTSVRTVLLAIMGPPMLPTVAPQLSLFGGAP